MPCSRSLRKLLMRASAERSPVEDWRMRRRKKRVASATRGSTESAINASCQFCRSITATITISVMPSTRITTMLLESRALMVSMSLVRRVTSSPVGVRLRKA